MKYSLFLLMALLLSACGQPDKPDTSLHLALENRDINQIERHIYWGSDLTQTTPAGLTPLHIAAKKGHIIAVGLLLDKKVPIDAETPDGHTPLFFAIMEGKTQIADLLLERGAKIEADQLLVDAAQHNVTDRDIISYLIKRGASTDYADAAGNTALMIAVQKDNHRLVRRLIKAGPKINHQNKQNENALLIAKQRGSTEIQQILIRNGAVLPDTKN